MVFGVSEPPAGRSLWSCFEGMGAALWSWFLVGSEGNVRHWSLLARCRQTDRQTDRQTGMPWCVAVSEPPAETSLWRCFEGMGAALWSWFLVGSEGNVRQWSLLARRRFRTSVPWCFAVSEPPAGRSLWSCFEGMGAALWSWFLVGSEGNVRQWSLLARCRFRPSVPWCFAVSEPPAGRSLWSCFEGMGAALWSWFLVGSEGNVRQWSLLARRRFRPSVPWCFGVSEPPAGRSLWSCFEGMGAALWSWFLVGSEGNVRPWSLLARCRQTDRQTDRQTGRQACHGVLLFRNRPLRLRCGAVLRAWELHCGAGFLSAQKATLGSGACLLGAASVLQCHGVLLFRNRPLGGRCGAVLRAWELHFGAGFLSVQKATLGSEPCLLGAASVLQCHGVLLFRNRPLGGRCDAVLRAWELHFGAGFLSVQKATLGTGACLLGADRQTDRAAWELHFGAGFLLAQKATLGSGACLLGAASVLQCHGVLLFRNRPLGGRCGAVLGAWELHFGAGFLSVQKATLGSGPCLLGAASVLQCHGVLLFRNRPLGGHRGAVLRAWELHFGAGFLSVPKATLGTGACLLGADRQTDRQADRQTGRQADRQTGRRADRQTGRQADRQAGRQTGRQANRGTGMPWCVAVSEPPAETSLWSCFEGMGAALWSWFLVGSEGNVRQWSLLARCRFRPSVQWCFAVSEPPAGRSLWSCFEGMGAALWSWFLVG